MPGPIGTLPIRMQSIPADRADDGRGGERRKALKHACRDFESLFVTYMLKQMRRTIPQDGLFPAGQAEKMYTAMMDSKIAEEISRQRGIGLSPVIYHQMMAALSETATKK